MHFCRIRAICSLRVIDQPVFLQALLRSVRSPLPNIWYLEGKPRLTPRSSPTIGQRSLADLDKKWLSVPSFRTCQYPVEPT